MNAKQKGNQFERHMAAILRAELWPGCYTSRFMGSAWDDYNGIDLTGTPGFNVQCKAQERLVKGYHEILEGMLKNNNTNIVIHKKNNKGCIVAMDLDDFIKLVKK
ncbi:MAG TPA: hypothetical protein VMV47_11360 [Bacteroidales bacterium]|nr:hypothetical protein [Bacteroidales bacterium]